MTNLQVAFDIPDNISAGLSKGDLIRRGGVIQKVAETPEGGEIVMWLRESSLSPLSPNQLISSTTSAFNILGMVGSVASVLNLGATIGFGIAILRKLKGIESHLKKIEGKIDKLQWTIELGFFTVLQSLETLKKYHEIEIIAGLNSAAELASGAQFFEPNSPQRMMRIEHALANATAASKKLILHVDSEMNTAISAFQSQRAFGNKRLVILDSVISAILQPAIRLPQELYARLNKRLVILDSAISALIRFRQMCIASSLKASINAESGSIESSIRGLEEEIQKLSSLLYQLGHSFLRGGGPDEGIENIVYDDLLNKKWNGIIHPDRVGMWASRFDVKISNLNNIIELMRMGKFEMTIFNHDYKWSKLAIKNLPIFADLLDGSYEDLDRLKGYLAEYKAALSMGLSIHEYRTMLEVSKDPEDKKLILLIKK